MLPLLGANEALGDLGCACGGDRLEGIAEWFKAASSTEAAPLFDCKDPGAVSAYLARSSASASSSGFIWGCMVGAGVVAAAVVFSRKFSSEMGAYDDIKHEIVRDVARAYIPTPKGRR